MGVYIDSMIAYGWKMNLEEYLTFNRLTNDEYEDSFIISNAYCDNTDFILGEVIEYTESGECKQFNVLSLFDKIPGDFVAKWHKVFQELDMEVSLPHFYLIGRVG